MESLKKLQAVLVEFGKDVKSQEGRLSGRQSEIAGAEAKIAELKAQINALEAQKAVEQNAVSSMKSDAQKQIDEKFRDLANLKASVEDEMIKAKQMQKMAEISKTDADQAKKDFDLKAQETEKVRKELLEKKEQIAAIKL
jgi:hypothetical protein